MASGSSLDPFAAAPRGSRAGDDDPFAEATSRSFEAPGGGPPRPPAGARVAQPGPLAGRDPDGPFDATAEYTAAGAVSFADVLRRARRQGFLAGAAAGGAAGATFVLVTWLLVGTSSVATVEVRGEPRAPEEAAPVRVVATPEPGAASDGAATDAAAAEAAATDPQDPLAVPRRRSLHGATAASGQAYARGEVHGAEEVRPGGALVEPREGPAGAEVLHHIELTGRPDGAPPDAGAGDVAPPEGGAREPAAADGGAAEPSLPAAPRAPGEREVMGALREHAEAIDECVALATGEEADVRGRRFRLLVVVEPSGAVSAARVLDAEVEAAPVGSCLVVLARQLSFPAFEGEPVHVEVPVRYGRSE